MKKIDKADDWERELDARTLEEVWAIVTRAWLDRRRHPIEWRLIANNAQYVGHCQREREPRAGGGDAR